MSITLRKVKVAPKGRDLTISWPCRRMRALKRGEQALETDLPKYLPLWRVAVPPDFENMQSWDFSAFGRGERYIDEPLPEEGFRTTFQQV